MRLFQLSRPHGHAKGASLDTGAVCTPRVRHPAQAVAESHRGAKAPSPAGNLPSERYLTRDLLLPATLDGSIVSASGEKSNCFFGIFPLFSG